MQISRFLRSRCINKFVIKNEIKEVHPQPQMKKEILRAICMTEDQRLMKFHRLAYKKSLSY
jgi:hypothetical protein